MRKRVAGLVLVVAAATSQAHAQRIRGVLTDSATRERVPGAVVILYDSAGRGLARVIAGADGQYTIGSSRTTRTMRVMRIGFRPRELAVGAGDSVVNVLLQPIPSLVAGVKATDRRVCDAASDGNPALDLWEQARAGLLASLVSRESSPPRIRLRTYRRTIEPVLRKIVADTAEYQDVVDGRSFVAARPPWVFATYGYLREEGGIREYYGPDESVLLDPTFAETHCLHAIEGRGPRAAQIGIAFDPIATPARDTVVDIAGALWLDRVTYAPHDIEFRYTNLEREGRDSGGEVDFALMPNGISMIERWQIRSVVVVMDVPATTTNLARRDIPRRDRSNARVLAYQHIGGEIADAVWPDGKHWAGNLPSIQGTVIDADSIPVANAVVWTLDRRDTVRTDAAGHFKFPPMEPGLYRVVATDSALAVEGILRSLPEPAVVLTSQSADVTVLLHSRAEVFPTVCPSKSYRPGSGVLFARVVDSLGAAVPSAQIEIETTARGDTTTRARAGQTRIGITGDDGRFVICGADRSERLVVRAFKGTRGVGVAIDRWGDEVLSLFLTIRQLKL